MLDSATYYNSRSKTLYLTEREESKMNTASLNATFQDSLSPDSENKPKSIIEIVFNALKNQGQRAKGRAMMARLNNHLLLDIGIDRPVNNDIVVERCWML